MTYVRTWSGWAYVAFVLDVYWRMIPRSSANAPPRPRTARSPDAGKAM